MSPLSESLYLLLGIGWSLVCGEAWCRIRFGCSSLVFYRQPAVHPTHLMATLHLHQVHLTSFLGPVLGMVASRAPLAGLLFGVLAGFGFFLGRFQGPAFAFSSGALKALAGFFLSCALIRWKGHLLPGGFVSASLLLLLAQSAGYLLLTFLFELAAPPHRVNSGHLGHYLSVGFLQAFSLLGTLHLWTRYGLRAGGWEAPSALVHLLGLGLLGLFLGDSLRRARGPNLARAG